MENKQEAACILIVEDDTAINNLEKKILDKSGYKVYQAFSGTEGLLLTQMHNEEIDVIIMDLMLPGLSGEELISELRKFSVANIIAVSSISDIDSKVNLLKLGANDYITKPFENKEFLARIEVQLRLSEGIHDRDESGNTESERMKGEITHKNLTIYQDKYEAYVCGEPLNLTRQEMQILKLFISNPNRVFSKQDIYEYAWNDTYIGEDGTVSVHISNIRKKISEFDEDEYIKTVWGIGFKLS